jgi:stage V sporulation protein G
VQITEVTIRLTNAGRLRARVSITINNSFMIRDVKVMRPREGGYVVEFPRRRQPDGSYLDIAAPINAETRKMLEERILAEYERVTGERVTQRR